MHASIRAVLERSRSDRKETKRFFQKLKRQTPKDLDREVHALHQEVFDEIDCLECANCCKTTSPIFRDIDIDRLADHLGIRPAALIKKYLQLDSEGDYVLQSAPCPFLDPDNYCSVYEHRPKACREYPHTSRKNFHQIFHLTIKNMEICPAVTLIIDKLKRVVH